MLMCLIDLMIEIAGHFTFVSLEILSLAISFTVSIVNRRRRWHLQGALPSFGRHFPLPISVQMGMWDLLWSLASVCIFEYGTLRRGCGVSLEARSFFYAYAWKINFSSANFGPCRECSGIPQ